jgi:hypothetical protein
MTRTTISRRAILKSIGLIGLGTVASSYAGLSPALAKALAQNDVPALPLHWQGQPFGRVTGLYQNARTEPSTSADVVLQHRKDDIVRVRKVVRGETTFSYNDLWLETDNGFMYSSFVQPLWYHLPNVPVSDLGDGRWAEVTVPYTDAYFDPDDSIGDRIVSRMYHGCYFRVTGLVTGTDGRSWYKVQEMYQSFYMRATHMRLIQDADLLPLHLEVDPRDKWIEIDLTKQLLIAWEKDRPVYAHRVATGLVGHGTPEGTHYVFDKRLSERMVGGSMTSDEFGDYYNLAGIVGVCYIAENWVATHGTFWHNDFGQTHSHGCVNLPNYASLWLWRWTAPYVTEELLDRHYVRPVTKFDGTRVEIHW